MSPADYSVTHFEVIVIVSKNPADCYAIAPLVATYQQAKDQLTPIIDEYPKSYIQEITSYFNTENDKERLQLIASIATENTANKAESRA